MNRVDLPQSTADSLADIFDRVGHGERLILDRGGKPLAAVVSIEDLATLEELQEIEDRQDAEDAERVLADIEAGRTKLIPWEEAEARLDR